MRRAKAEAEEKEKQERLNREEKEKQERLVREGVEKKSRGCVQSVVIAFSRLSFSKPDIFGLPSPFFFWWYAMSLKRNESEYASLLSHAFRIFTSLGE